MSKSQCLSLDELKKTLATLEERLEAPLMPGDLDGWSGRIRAAAGAVRPCLARHLTESHPPQYAEIIEQDISLVVQVDQLKAEDAAVLKEFDRFAADADRFAAAAAKVEPDEAAIESLRKRFADDGLGLILRIRKHEAALRAWYSEAFDRDDGVGD
ncbi:MAG: hypothetical protein K8T25_09395 [Planctomycetia bacterium]|nr:hypothetical protein [Planctomycetia bacterium]